MKRVTLDDRLKSCKRRYRKTLQDLLLTIQGELEVLDDDSSDEITSAIEMGAFRLIQEHNQFKALLDVEK